MQGDPNKTAADVTKHPYMTVDSLEWKRLWTQPCPLCRDPLLDHAKQGDLDNLVEALARVQRGGKAEITGPDRMTCLKCDCFLPRTTLFQQIIKSAESRVYFRQEQEADVQRILEEEGLTPPPDRTIPTEEQLQVILTLFDPIVGYDDVKDLFRRALTARRPVHVALQGPPASAKTLFLTEVGRLPGSFFVVGGSTSKAGLTDALLTYRPAYLLVDEIETITNPRDYATLLHLMENQQVVEAKYGRHHVEPMSVSVFAAGNDLSRLDPALISRFGGPKCVVHFKEYTPKEFLEVTVNVLVKREGVAPEFAKKVAEAMLGIRTLDVRSAVHVARLAEDEYGLASVITTLQRRR